jgi:hypothetical protein
MMINSFETYFENIPLLIFKDGVFMLQFSLVLDDLLAPYTIEKDREQRKECPRQTPKPVEFFKKNTPCNC